MIQRCTCMHLKEEWLKFCWGKSVQNFSLTSFLSLLSSDKSENKVLRESYNGKIWHLSSTQNFSKHIVKYLPDTMVHFILFALLHLNADRLFIFSLVIQPDVERTFQNINLYHSSLYIEVSLNIYIKQTVMKILTEP